jgi:hypothetical protein
MSFFAANFTSLKGVSHSGNTQTTLIDVFKCHWPHYSLLQLDALFVEPVCTALGDGSFEISKIDAFVQRQQHVNAGRKNKKYFISLFKRYSSNSKLI